jgi:hypothetical protein
MPFDSNMGIRRGLDKAGAGPDSGDCYQVLPAIEMLRIF